MEYNLIVHPYQLYVYDYPPLDWTFCFFTVNEFKERIRNLDKEDFFTNTVLKDREALIREIENLLTEAESAAREGGWDGVYRNEPLLFAIPAGEEINVMMDKVKTPCGTFNQQIGTILFGIIIKQDNDGVTFLYSPIKLNHLEQ